MIKVIYANDQKDNEMVFGFLLSHKGNKSDPIYGTVNDFYSYLLNVCNLCLGDTIDLIDNNTAEVIRTIKVCF